MKIFCFEWPVLCFLIWDDYFTIFLEISTITLWCFIDFIQNQWFYFILFWDNAWLKLMWPIFFEFEIEMTSNMFFIEKAANFKLTLFFWDYNEDFLIWDDRVLCFLIWDDYFSIFLEISTIILWYFFAFFSKSMISCFLRWFLTQFDVTSIFLKLEWPAICFFIEMPANTDLVFWIYYQLTWPAFVDFWFFDWLDF